MIVQIIPNHAFTANATTRAVLKEVVCSTKFLRTLCCSLLIFNLHALSFRCFSFALLLSRFLGVFRVLVVSCFLSLRLVFSRQVSFSLVFTGFLAFAFVFFLNFPVFILILRVP